MNWCILIPLAVGAICALLGYLLGKSLGGEQNSQVDIDVWKSKVLKLEADLNACKESKPSGLGIKSSFVDEASAIIFNADKAKAVFGKDIEENDLTIIEGIGPKIQELFNNHDIRTWKDLSDSSIEKCQEVLNSGGERFKIHNPGTWREQARMAYKGHWEDLLKWQDDLDGGK